MSKYLLWMLKYSEGLRHILEKEENAEKMSYDQLLALLESEGKCKSLTDFLEQIGASHLSVDEKTKKLEENYDKFFKVAA